MKDWIIRALKTFVQAFFGVLIPEIIAMLNHYMEFDWGKWTTYLPLITAALAAGISAAWNIILETMNAPKIEFLPDDAFDFSFQQPEEAVPEKEDEKDEDED